MPRPLKFRERLDRYPPVLVRLMARRGYGLRGWPTDDEVAAEADLPVAQVKSLGFATSWDGIPINVAYRFFDGCHVDLEHRPMFRRYEWLRRVGRFQHLQASPHFDDQIRPMLDLVADYEASHRNRNGNGF